MEPGRGEHEHETRLARALSNQVMAFFDHILWYGIEPTEDFCGISGAM